MGPEGDGVNPIGYLVWSDKPGSELLGFGAQVEVFSGEANPHGTDPQRV